MLFICQTITTVDLKIFYRVNHTKGLKTSSYNLEVPLRYDTLLFLKVFAFFFPIKILLVSFPFSVSFFFRYEDRPDIFHQDILQTQSAICTVFFS